MAVGKILFLYNAVADAEKRGYFPQLMSCSQIDVFSEVLNNTGHQVVQLNLRSPEQLRDFVRTNGPFNIAFCIAEGFLDLPAAIADGSGAAWVRRVLADLGVEATHSAAPTMEVCWYKDRTHQALSRLGLPIPQYCVIRPELESLKQQLQSIEQEMTFPLFVKPAAGGTSVGISERSLVSTPQELGAQVHSLLREFKNLPVLVETYLRGREYTVGVMGNRDKLVLPIIAFPLDQKVRTLRTKRNGDKSGQEKIAAGDPRYRLLSGLAVDVFDAVGAQDVVRIDFKEDGEGKPVVIDVNGSPALTPSASLAQMAAWAGFSYQQFIELFINIALERVCGQVDSMKKFRKYL